MRSIGDVLDDHDIPWNYNRGGYNASVAGNPVNGYFPVCNPFEYLADYPSQRADHIRDVTDLSSTISETARFRRCPTPSRMGRWMAIPLPRSSTSSRPSSPTSSACAKQQGAMGGDSHLRHDRRRRRLLQLRLHSAGRPGPRIPMTAVSRFSTGGHISNVYKEHSSFVKFVERNWKLNTAPCDHSRDNLPNPKQGDDNDADDYVPRNMPAIGDLFDLFDFGHHLGQAPRRGPVDFSDKEAPREDSCQKCS